MIKIFLKAAILVFIILSIYLIVNPSACSNLMMGRAVTPMDTELAPAREDHSEMFTPAGDQKTSPAPAQQPQGVFDTNTLHEAQQPAQAPVQQQPATPYSQADIDYAVASRYVELENEYAKKQAVGKDAAKEISYIVMDDFEMTQQEWEDFLQRATQSNLFDKVRGDLPAQNK